MKTEILDLGLIDKKLIPAKSELSFQPFVAFLQSLIDDQPLKEDLFRSFILKFERAFTGRESITIEETAEFEELLEMIYMFVTPIISKESKHVWALSTPVPGEIFYSTDAFYSFYIGDNSNAPIGDFETKNILSGKEKVFFYQLILRRFYNIDSSVYTDSHIQGLNPKDNNPVFYRIHIDTRFLNISYSGDLPQLDTQLIETWLLDPKGEKYLENLLPLSNFQIKGFSILEFTDVTEEHAIENLKNIIVDHKEEIFSEGINETLQSLVGKRNLRFGILPFIKLNNRTIYLSESSTSSILMNAAIKYRVKQDIYHQLVEQFENNPEAILHNNISSSQFTEEPLIKILKYAGIESFALLAVVFLKKVVGVLEVYSPDKVFIDKLVLSKLQGAMPYIGQLVKHISDNFANSIEQAVSDNFTSIKSPVKWKFKEVVGTYLNAPDISTAEIGRVKFEKLYPFYGAIDIRQSSIERNNAVLEDITDQIELLTKILNDPLTSLNDPLAEVLLMNKQKWLGYFDDFKETGDEITFNSVVQEEVEPFLIEAAEASLEANELIKPYLQSISETEGAFHKHRRELESSMHIINSSINQHLTTYQKELQNFFPHYFDRFRTDGVEYDIYLGQSIAPYRTFSMEHVKHMRLWQLKSMAEIGLITRNLRSKMLKDLQTTQLIFIHSSPITIGFRNDEKRFDVEGGSSIRYEVVKKRIDKVLIKSTHERLTQPDKIAMVYFSQSEENEYLEYILILQQQGLLKDELEFLELEDLQGVHGLKALRVRIN
ncbi:hypothetical protein [Desertivirga xinjiangensis]|uniref:hypothetical protein n=1 Tax=Desertivirga xinjiangensis TaxID=539206 RepID=UPI00210ADE1F|nr:hypothetical protein [Pedobacter xinjiangensis]